MTESRGLINGKNLIVWIAIASIVIGSIVDSALTRSQVERNTKELETYNLSVLSYKMDEMDEKLDKITTLLENL